MKRITDEEFLKLKGWSKEEGFKINLEDMRDYPDSWDSLYIRHNDLTDFVVKCTFWTLEEEAHEDMDYIIENKYEEYMDEEGNVYDEPVQDLSPKS